MSGEGIGAKSEVFVGDGYEIVTNDPLTVSSLRKRYELIFEHRDLNKNDKPRMLMLRDDSMGTTPWSPILLYKAYPEGIPQGMVNVDIVRPVKQVTGDVKGEYLHTVQMPDNEATSLIELLRLIEQSGNNRIGVRNFQNRSNPLLEVAGMRLSPQDDLANRAQVYLKLLRSVKLAAENAQYRFETTGFGALKFEYLILPDVRWPKSD